MAHKLFLISLLSLVLVGCGQATQDMPPREYNQQALAWALKDLGYHVQTKKTLLHNREQYKTNKQWNLIVCEINDFSEQSISKELLTKFNWPDDNPDAQIITGKTVCAIRYPEYQRNKIKQDIAQLHKEHEQAKEKSDHGHAEDNHDHSAELEAQERMIKHDPTVDALIERILMIERAAEN